VFSVTVFTVLLGSGFQQCSVFGFQRLLSSVAALSAAAPELYYNYNNNY
jgi:hypothetical protein